MTATRRLLEFQAYDVRDGARVPGGLFCPDTEDGMRMRKSVLLLAAMSLALLLAGGAAWAAAGDLDPSFGGGDGKVVSTEPCFVCQVSDLEVLPDSGKIVAFSDSGILARYNPDGSLDDTFGGGDGVVKFGYSGDGTTGSMYTNAFMVQPDGGLIVGGHVPGRNSEPQFILARFLPDGTFDTSFGGGDGTVAIGFGERASEEVAALAMQGGKIVAAGEAFSSRVGGVALARFLPNGTLDTTFGGGDGRQIKSVPGSSIDVRDLAVLPDNRLMVAGGSTDTTGSTYHGNVFLTRFLPGGPPDKSFGGGDGEVTTGYAKDTNDFATSLAVSGSRAVVAGATYAAGKDAPARFALFAYANDGSPARSFGGGDGKLKTVFGVGDAVARDLVFTPGDGKLLVVGQQNRYARGHRGIDFALARYKPDGTLDASFGGGDGKLTTNVSPGTEDFATTVDVDGDGKAVVGGSAVAYNSANGQYNTVFGLARYGLE